MRMYGQLNPMVHVVATWTVMAWFQRTAAQGTIRHCVKDTKEDDVVHIYCPPTHKVSVQSIILGHNKWRTCVKVKSSCIDNPRPDDVITCVSRDKCGYVMQKYSVKCGRYLDFVRIIYTCHTLQTPGPNTRAPVPVKSTVRNLTRSVIVWRPLLESTTPTSASGELGPGVIAGAFCGTLCVSALCILAACFYRRKRQLDDVNKNKLGESVSNEYENQVSVAESSLTFYAHNESGYASSETNSAQMALDQPPRKREVFTGQQSIGVSSAHVISELDTVSEKQLAYKQELNDLHEELGTSVNIDPDVIL